MTEICFSGLSRKRMLVVNSHGVTVAHLEFNVIANGINAYELLVCAI